MKPIIKIVKNMPPECGDAIGYQKPGTNIIYIRKGYNSLYLREHEKLHLMKRHPDKPRKPFEFIDHEIEAEVYAIKVSKTHRQTKHMIRAMLNSFRESYPWTVLRTYQLIGQRIKSHKLDSHWTKAYKELGKEIKEYMRLEKVISNHYILYSKDHRNYGEFFTGVEQREGKGTLFYFYKSGGKGGKRKQQSVFIIGLTEKELLQKWEEIRDKYL